MQPAAPEIERDAVMANRPGAPADAVAVYQRVADEVLERADRRAYAAAVRILKRARAAAQGAGALAEFSDYIGRLREQYRRRPALISMLDRANLR